MALQESGPISLANVQTEFGGSNPIGIDEYYGVAAGVPASGAISLDDFYGTSATLYETISSDTDNYNMFTGFGSPAGIVNVELTINSGVVVGSTTTATAALRTGNFVAGSTLTVINNGQIIAKGGIGGAGSTNSGCTDSDGSPGLIGGDAIDMAEDLTIDNTNGDVFGGGGGGGGGGNCVLIEDGASGGGGGGGAGDNGGSGGAVGTQTGCTVNGSGQAAGSAGTTTGGSGGSGGDTGGTLRVGGDGGDGGEYGAAGVAGGCGRFNAGACDYGLGGAGGAAGKAVDKNGNTLTWLGGNNPTQVKGAQT